ncbi:hypothetical protein [Effusibacillus lacus]|uniref:UGSC-like domain-containing protein n=2 Tax=Effusibacillus lacus TaxID=1348429 RepID=A0A292YQD2_9BACL|nr:hypothetical protein EDD64_1313 [Effusibacillus lacus]GAX90614.1 hypothetical protein [Effusibacillus lacus]
MNNSGKFIVLDPTESPARADQHTATRLDTLEGKVLAVVNNGKRNSDVFLRALLDEIQSRFNLKEVIWVDKTNVSLPMPPETLQRLRSCEAVISGVGD